VENRPSLGRCFSIRGSWQLAQLCFQESEVDGLGEEIGGAEFAGAAAAPLWLIWIDAIMRGSLIAQILRAPVNQSLFACSSVGTKLFPPYPCRRQLAAPSENSPAAR